MRGHSSPRKQDHMADPAETHPATGDTNVIIQIARAVNALRYGSVEIIVHDGRIVQIERREKLRLEASINRDK